MSYDFGYGQPVVLGHVLCNSLASFWLIPYATCKPWGSEVSYWCCSRDNKPWKMLEVYKSLGLTPSLDSVEPQGTLNPSKRVTCLGQIPCPPPIIYSRSIKRILCSSHLGPSPLKRVVLSFIFLPMDTVTFQDGNVSPLICVFITRHKVHSKH